MTGAKVTLGSSIGSNGHVVPFSNQTANVPVGIADPSNPSVGTFAVSIQYNLSKSQMTDTFGVIVEVNGNFIGNDAPGVPITVAVPVPGGMILGDGQLVGDGSGGLLKADAGSTVGVGFNVTYNKSLTNPQGKVIINFVSGGKKYQIKSTAINTLALTMGASGTANCPSGGSCDLAQFSSKATIVRLNDNGSVAESIDGGANLIINLHDYDAGNAGPNTSSTPDTVSIQLISTKDGHQWFATNWSGTKSIEAPLTGLGGMSAGQAGLIDVVTINS